METKHIQKIEETDDAITVTFGKAKPEEEKAKVKADETPEVKEEPKEKTFEEKPNEEQAPEDKTFENEVANKELKSKKVAKEHTFDSRVYLEIKYGQKR